MRCLGYFVNKTQLKRAQLHQWRFFASKSLPELVQLGMPAGEAAGFLARALKAS
jgi:hypothetical protein